MAANEGAAGTSHWGSQEAAEAWRQGEARRAQQFGAATELMLDLAGVGVGQRVLDVAAGTGEQTVLAAQRVGPTGWVLATDVSASMLESTTNAARATGLANVAAQVLDARHLELDSESFDAAICRNGLQWIPDPEAVLSNILTALRPGGKLAVLVHGAPERNPWIVLPAPIIRRLGALPPPPPGEPDACALGAPGMLEAAFRRAGYRDVAVYPTTIERKYPSASAAVTALREAGGFLLTLIAPLGPDQREQAWAEVTQAFKQFAGPTGVDLSSESLVGVGTK